MNFSRRNLVMVAILILVILFLGVFTYRSFFVSTALTIATTPTPIPTPTSTPTPTPSPTPTPTTLSVVRDTSQIMGVDAAQGGISYAGIGWVRVSYPTCGWGNLRGTALQQTVEHYHQQGIRVLLTVCQGHNDASLYETSHLTDAAHGNADAVQCGNEEMKYDPAVAFLYIPPANFARFYDLCEHAMHSVRSEIPVLLGSLDPHVGGIDYQPLVNQVDYLNQMQTAMNTTVHPGGHWDWHTQTLGLIDSWHNGWSGGYADNSVNSLGGLFSFWAQQFGVDVNGGQLGKHLWVVEGTGCFKGCGVDPYNSYQVATSHILALITDVQTSKRSSVPFFFFSGKDFYDQGIYWPIGILTAEGHQKPLRQDLTMGARALTMSCGSKSVTISTQEDLLAKMYSNCALPGDYLNTLMS